MRQFRKCGTGLVVLALAVSSVCAQTAALPDSAKLVPSDTLFLLSVGSVQQVRTQIEKTRFYEMTKDPAMQPFIERFKTELGKLLDEQDSEWLQLITNTDLQPKGRLFVCVGIPEGADLDSDEGSIVALVQWGDNFAQARAFLDKEIQKQIDKGAHKKEEKFRGRDLITLIIPPDKPAADADADSDSDQRIEPEPTEVYYCYLEDGVLVGDDPETLQFTLAQLDGAQSPTLADSEQYRQSRRAVGPTYDAEMYLNLGRLMETFAASMTSEDTPDAPNYIKLLGLDGIKDLSMAMAVAPQPGTTSTFKAILATDNPRRGILKMLELGSKPFRAPLFVDPQAGQVLYVNFNFPAATDTLFRTLAAINPMFAAMLNNPITPPQADGSPGLILKDDLLDKLGEQIIYANTITVDPAAELGFTQDQLFAIEVQDAERLGRTIAELHTQFIAPGKPDAQREYLGYTLYTIPLPGMLMPNAGLPEDPDAGIAVAVTQTHALIGSVKSVQKALQRQTEPATKPLNELDWYRRAATLIPADAGMASVENVQLYGEGSWEMLKSGKLGGLIAVDLDNDKVKAILSTFEALPDFKTVKKYFGINVSWLTTRPDGFFMTATDIPAPPEAN